ncbi:hypothetical protein D8674_015017 [Pyrus ussuriensis x Pyrus communis]|uniref:Uncharacterized protein n=1 Tax=Pyrus ussuriensis x Pyrus communis TaxID=2448454 RepID=A0A5N5GV18_9ROSA|nr:hypothetical protein D8674_015017 [Pyrus ussuriensis x Pyrus communis]
MDSTLFQLVKKSPLELKQIDSEILTLKFKSILRNIVKIMGDLKAKPYSATSLDWHSLYLVASRVRCAIPKQTDPVIDPVVSFRSVIQEVIDKLNHKGTMIELETLHNLTLLPILLSHPSLLRPKKGNSLRMWSYAKNFQTHHFVNCTQGYILRLVTIELENVYASHGGDLLTLDWKTSFELQDYGSRLRHLLRDYHTNYNGSNMLDFLKLSRHIAMDAKHRLGITDAEIDMIFSNSFPGFLGVLFESICNRRRRNHRVNFTSTWRYTAK